MKYCEYTNTGIIRSVNQDSLLSLSMNGSGLFVVADGMGGHIDGEIASKAVKKACQKWWNTSFMENSDMDFLLAVEEIKAAIEIVNKNLIKKMEGTGKICGTTVAVVFIHNGAYAAMNIGDSRIYLSNKRGVRKISFDHTLNSFEEIKNTALSEKDKLTQAIGVKEDLSWYTATDTLKNDEKFFICTDGVYKYTEEEDLFSAIKNYSEEEEIKKEIEKQVILGGAPDNFSFIAIDMRKEKASVSRKPLIIVSAIAVALFVIFTVIFAVAVSGDKGENIQTVMSEKLSLGQKFLLDLEYDKAVAEFVAVIEIEPKNVDAYVGLADAYIGMGEKDKAIETLEKGFAETGDETIREKLMGLKTPEETTAEVTTTPETTTTPEETTTEETTTTLEETTEKVLTISKRVDYESGWHSVLEYDYYTGVLVYQYNYRPDGTLDSIYRYLSNGHVIEESYVSDNEIDMVDEFDENKNLVRRAEYYDGGEHLRYVEWYCGEYYGQLRVIKKELYYSDGRIQLIQEYDKHANLIKQTQYSYDDDRNIVIRVETENTWEYRIEYGQAEYVLVESKNEKYVDDVRTARWN